MPTECAYELDKRPLISIAVQRHAMLCLVFTGNEFKTRLDVKLQTDALLSTCLCLQLIWCHLAWITDTKPAAYYVLMSCKSSVWIVVRYVSNRVVCFFLISGFLAFCKLQYCSFCDRVECWPKAEIWDSFYLYQWNCSCSSLLTSRQWCLSRICVAWKSPLCQNGDFHATPICDRQTEFRSRLFDDQFSSRTCLQCFDAVGWVAGRASGL